MVSPLYPLLMFLLAYQLGKVAYGWNTGLIECFHGIPQSGISSSKFRIGFSLALSASRGLSQENRTRLYCIALFFIGYPTVLLILVIPFHFLELLAMLHFMAVAISFVASVFIGHLAGALLFVSTTVSPGRLLAKAAVLTIAVWLLIWLATPTSIQDGWRYRYTWPGGMDVVPLYPLVLPVYAGTALLLGMIKAGIDFARKG